ncbi:MAG: right-handed parallel beta-helix repeat-containing protein [Bacteroidales bacterium]|nr:right-handed parallel beta-helix repeat-containing protein [Bacteroidales bacterium]
MKNFLLLFSFILINIAISFGQNPIIQETEKINNEDKSPIVHPTKVSRAIYHDVLPSLKDLPPVGAEYYLEVKDKAPWNNLQEEMEGADYSNWKPMGDDPAWQKEMGTVEQSKGISQNFAGQTSPYLPSDCNGTVGPDHFFQTVNSTYAVYNKTGGTVVSATAMNTLFAGVTGASNNDGDPLILWDEDAGRWLAVEFSISSTPDYMLVALSQTSDPTGSWDRWSFVMNGMPDYEKIGINSDGYFLSTNTYTGDDVYVFERDAMIAGSGSPQMVQFENPNRPNPTSFNAIIPLDGDGSFNSDHARYIAINDDAWGYSVNGGDELWVFDCIVDWGTPSNSTFGRSQVINVSAFDSQFNSWGVGDLAQSGNSQLLDANPYVLMTRAQFKNIGGKEYLVCDHTVDVDATNHAGIRWYQLELTGGTWVIKQEGTYAPDANSRWMGSIAMNDYGQIALAYSITSSSMTPQIRYTGQTSCGGVGVMDVAEQSVATSLTPTAQPSYNRWGDYFLTTVDPNDNLTFWSSIEYYNSGKKTQVFSFTIDEACNAPTLSAIAPTTFYADKGKQISVTGTDLLGCSFSIGGVTATISSNDGTDAVIIFPPGKYSNNTLTVSNFVGDATSSVTVSKRNTIPVDASAGPNDDTHQTIDGAVDGLAAWYGTDAFNTGDLPGTKTIEVAGGTYIESVTLTNTLNPTVANPLIFSNKAGETPIIDATGENYGFDLSTVDYVQLKGFSVANANAANIYAQGDNCELYYNKVYNGSNADGIKLENGGTNNIHNNLLYNNERYALHVIGSNNNNIQNNTTVTNGGVYSPLQNVELWNEGFETGAVGWTLNSPWAIYTGVPHTGTSYLAALKNSGNTTAIGPSVSIAGYNNIEISFWYYCTGNDATDHLRCFYNVDGAGDVQFFDITGSQGAYTYFTYSLPTTGNNIVLTFQTNNGNSEYSRVDDIIIIGDENVVGGNLGSELYVESGIGNTVQNNIFYAKNGADYYSVQTGAGVTISSDYNTYFANGNANLFNYNGTIGNAGPMGVNDLTYDPLFVGSGDYHLQSENGSYTNSKAPIWPPETASDGVWSNDASSSPALDKGNPADTYSNEPVDNGSRINMGVFGNTVQASKAPPLPCIAPSTQASVFTSTPAATSIDLSWTRGDGDNVIILAHEASVVDADPISGNAYTANVAFGSGDEIGTGNFVVYNNNGTSVTVTGLTAGVTYYFTIYEYYNTDICYLAPGASTNTTTLLPAPTISNVSPNNFFADKGATLTITGTNLGNLTTSVDIAGVSGTVTSNNGTTLVVNFPAGLYTTNVLTASTGVNPDATSTVTVNKRNIIPVGGGTDSHATIQSALDGLFAWFGTSAFSTGTAGYLAGTKYIDVYAGTYTETATPNVTLNPIAGNTLVIQNHTGDAPVIDASGLTNGVNIGELDYVTVTGFTIHSSNDALITSDGDNNIFSFNKLYGSVGGTGLLLNTASTATVQNNLIYSNYNYGIRIISSNNVTLKNNTLAINGHESKAPPLPGIYDAAQLYVESGTGTTVENNIFYCQSGTLVYTMITESGITVSSDYNTYFKNGNSYLVEYNGANYADLAAWSGNGAGANEVETTPDFVNVGTDWHIKSTEGSYAGGEWPPLTAVSGTWTLDATTSTALDAGNPVDPFANEPQSGSLINQGAYGNTVQASKSPSACTAPTTQASSITATSTTSTSIDLTWTRGDGDNVIILAHQAAVVDANPVDGTSYTANTVFGSGTQIGTGNYVVYIGSATGVTVTNLLANTTYYFSIFEFNNTDVCYLTPGATANELILPDQPSAITGLATPCEGTTQTYSVTNVVGITYTWTVPADWTIDAGQGTNSITVTVGTNNGNVQVTPSNATGDGTARALAVTVSPLPTAPTSVSASVDPICVGDATELSYIGGSGTTFGWYTSSCGGTLVGTGNNLSVSPVATTTYYGRWENACGNSTCESVTVTVNDVPAQPSVITGNATPIQGASETYSVTNVVGVTYTWSVPGDWTIDAGQGTNSIDVTVGATSGNVTVTPSNSCGDGTPRVLAVTVSLSPTISNVSPDNFFTDKGKTLTITGSNLGGMGATVTIGAVSGTVTSNDGSTLVVDFPAEFYSNNTLTVATGVGTDATATVTVNKRNIIPVGGGTDFHTTIQSALDGLQAWYKTTSFDAGQLPGAKYIDVYNGTYTENVTPDVTLVPTATNRLFIQNHSGEAPVIDASTLTNAVYIGTLDNVTVTGFTMHSSSDVVIYTEGDNNTISYNKVYGSTGGSGIILNSAIGTTVQNNLVYNNYNFGVRIISSNNAVIKNNTIANNTHTAKAPPLPGIYDPAELYVESGTGITVENNIIYAKSGIGSYTLKTEFGVTVSSDYSTYFKNGNANLVSYNGVNYADLAAWTGNGAGANEVETDPDFVNAGTDWHIKSTAGSYASGEWPPFTVVSGVWTLDATISTALDAGNPVDPFVNEPQSGSIINQGAYGNTVQASKTPVTCTPPTTQANTFVATATGSATIDLSWARGDGDNVIILAHEAAVVDADPVEGVTYTDNTAFGSGDEIGTGNFVVYIGNGTTTTVTGLTAGTTYYFAIYEFFDADHCYLIPGATDNATTDVLSPTISNVTPDNFFTDKGKTLTITGSGLGDMSATVTIGTVTGTVTSNDGSTLVVDFPAEFYSNNTLTVATGVGTDATSTVIVNKRNIIPVGGGADFHTTIQSALDGLQAWYKTTSFDAGQLPGAKYIDVYNGTYAEIVTPDVTLVTTATNGLFIQNHVAEAPVINASGLANGVFIGNLAYVTVIGFTIHSSIDAGIYTEGDNNTISHNRIYGSTAGSGVLVNNAPSTTVINNLITDNYNFGVRLISSNNVIVKNNTLANNAHSSKAPPLPGTYDPAELYVESGTGVSVENNIFYAKSGIGSFTLKTEVGITVTSDYNTYFKNGNTNLVYYNGTVYADLAAWTGNGAGANEVESSPDFVNAGTDWHIKSAAGSYAGGTWPPYFETGGAWVLDATTSTALDAGNPVDPFANEPQSGNRINQGAYGNTAQASKSVVTDLTWDGSESTDWQDPANWTPEFVPASGNNAIIPIGCPNYPIIDDGALTAVCFDLSIAASDASVTIATNGQMTVYGTVVNARGVDGIIVQSDATGDGSLIENTAVSATVGRFLSTAGSSEWHFISTAITSQSTTLFGLGMYDYDEIQNDWWTGPDYYFTGPSGWSDVPILMSVAEGYIWYGGQQTINYQGVLNVNPAYTIPASYTLHGGLAANGDPYTNFDGWVLVGNPYPCALDWEQLDKTDDITSSVYYYDDDIDNYAVYTDGGASVNGGTQYIPSGQAFFVKTNDQVDGGSITIPEYARTHNDQAFWKSPEDVQYIRLKVTSGDYYDESLIMLNELAYDEFDDRYDAFKHFSWNPTVPQIFSMSEERDVKYAINCFNFDDFQRVIPLGFKFATAGNQVIEFTENTVENTYIIMHDVINEEYTLMPKGESYIIETDNQLALTKLELILEKNVAPVIINDLHEYEVYEDVEFKFSIPTKFYSDPNIFDKISVSATTVGGNALPQWLNFDESTLTFYGKSDFAQRITVRLTVTDYFGAVAYDDFDIVVKSATSIAELGTHNITLFPIPTEDKLYLTVDGERVDYDVIITTMNGAQVFESNFTNDRTNSIDVSSLASGVYMMTIIFEDNSTVIRKVIRK